MTARRPLTWFDADGTWLPDCDVCRDWMEADGTFAAAVGSIAASHPDWGLVDVARQAVGYHHTRGHR